MAASSSAWQRPTSGCGGCRESLPQPSTPSFMDWYQSTDDASDGWAGKSYCRKEGWRSALPAPRQREATVVSQLDFVRYVLVEFLIINFQELHVPGVHRRVVGRRCSQGWKVDYTSLASRLQRTWKERKRIKFNKPSLHIRQSVTCLSHTWKSPVLGYLWHPLTRLLIASNVRGLDEFWKKSLEFAQKCYKTVIHHINILRQMNAGCITFRA